MLPGALFTPLPTKMPGPSPVWPLDTGSQASPCASYYFKYSRFRLSPPSPAHLVGSAGCASVVCFHQNNTGCFLRITMLPADVLSMEEGSAHVQGCALDERISCHP